MRLSRSAAVVAVWSFGATAPAGGRAVPPTPWNQGASGHSSAATGDATNSRLETCASCGPTGFSLGLERSESGGAFGWLSGEAFMLVGWNDPNGQGDERAALLKKDGQTPPNEGAAESNPSRGAIDWTDLPADFTAAPEPANVGLVAIGLTVLAIFGRIRRWRRVHRGQH